MAYPSCADLVAASDLDALTAASTEAQDGWYATSKRLVEAFCGQSFEGEDDLTILVDGNGSSSIALPRRLATMDSMAGGSLDASDVTLSDDHDRIYISSSVSGGTWVDRAMAQGGTSFPEGPGAISITGTWGFSDEEMPADDMETPVAIALRLDMEAQALAASHGLAATARAQSRLGLPDLREGSVSAQVRGVDQLLPTEAQLVLEPFIWQLQPVVA